MPENKWAKVAYHRQRNMAEEGEECWGLYIKRFLEELGMRDYWVKNVVDDLPEFKRKIHQKVMDQAAAELRAEAMELWDIRDPSSPIFAMFFPPLPGNEPYMRSPVLTSTRDPRDEGCNPRSFLLGRRLFATGLHGFLVEYDFSNPLQAKFRSQHLTGGGAWCLDVVEVGRTGLLAMGTEKGCVSMGNACFIARWGTTRRFKHRDSNSTGAMPPRSFPKVQRAPDPKDRVSLQHQAIKRMAAHMNTLQRASSGADEHSRNIRTLFEIARTSDCLTPKWSVLLEVTSEVALGGQGPRPNAAINEAAFVFMISEAQFVNALDLCYATYIKCPELCSPSDGPGVLSREESDALFGSFLEVRKSAINFLLKLDQLWQQSVYIDICRLCDIIKGANRLALSRYTERYPYIRMLLDYFSQNRQGFNQVVNDLDLTLQTLRGLECYGLNQLLKEPVLRMTQYLALVFKITDALKQSKLQNTKQYEAAMQALEAVSETRLPTRQNFLIQQAEMADLFKVIRGLSFGSLPPLHLISGARGLVKRTRVRELWLANNETATEDDSTLFTKRQSKINKNHGQHLTHKLLSSESVDLILFTDVLLVVKFARSTSSFVVVNYSQRNTILLLKLPDPFYIESAAGDCFLNRMTLLVLLENALGGNSDLVIQFNSNQEIAEWEKLLDPTPQETTEGDTIFAAWDPPDSIANFRFTPTAASGEIELDVGDCLKIWKINQQGMCYGENISTMEVGYFPKCYVHFDCDSPHARAKQLRQAYKSVFKHRPGIPSLSLALRQESVVQDE
ncbi:unnamed protein product [Cyprideis torosa]|uniref:Uncharacterized protein n=1 Tax=Cyprideis torosa TaxID=163714 RepID=A0A7R8WE95_9CRUS|nr:unnamed protein product [Cyprideis torosa]CAG0895585.1 unnamed protein product [Cyprideis torosa]